MSAATHTPKQTDTAFNAGLAIADLWRQHDAADQVHQADADTLFERAMEATHHLTGAPCQTANDIAAISAACVALADVANTGARDEHRKRCLDSILVGTARVAAAASALGGCSIADLMDEAGVARVSLLAVAA